MDGSNAKIMSLASRLVEPNMSKTHRRHEEEDEEDMDAIFAELEEELDNDSNAAMREHGMVAFKAEMERMKEMRENQHGSYREVTDEKEIVHISAHEPRCVIHFFHPNFKRCEIMDKHLAKLAPKYFNTRFLRVFVENIPWLVEKLGIKVLPCVILFSNGVAKDRIIGFEELGNGDGFETATLELRLSMAGVIEKSGGAQASIQTVYSGRPQNLRRDDNNDDVFDLDD